MMEHEQLYRSIAERTGGDIYIGVVGPVRSGKSTFVKKLAELAFLPAIHEELSRSRARDELPQSAAGRTIMTTEPKFIPEKAVTVKLEGGGAFRGRVIDCVGYMVEGALGSEENQEPRMVKSPWFEEEVPFELAAETGTRKVITEHATIAVVVTTDGTISNIPREKYLPPERRVIAELKAAAKPFVILLNSAEAQSSACSALAAQMEKEYGHAVLPVNCETLTREQIDSVLERLLYDFPICEICYKMPLWVTMLEKGHWLQQELYSGLLAQAEGMSRMQDAVLGEAALECPNVQMCRVVGMDLSCGVVTMELTLHQEVFYRILEECTGLEIGDEAGLVPCIVELARAKKAYDKVRSALEQTEATGYGIVMPSLEELALEEPEIIRQGGKYGVRLRASAPSIHMMKATIETEIAPIVGSERQSEDLVTGLLKDFENDPLKIWESNIFGKSLHELVNEGLQSKLLHMPQEARLHLQETVERVINEGCSGLVCIII